MIFEPDHNLASASCYANRCISLLTQHGKEKVMVPLLEQAFACQVVHVQGYDTDQLGTFTREIPRIDNQIGTARNKARIGMRLAGVSLGIASEGAFGPDPFMGIMPWNRELIVLIDDEEQIEIVGEAQGPGNHRHLLTSDWSEALRFAETAGFPEQRLIIRPDNEYDTRIQKDISEFHLYEKAFLTAAGHSRKGQVFIETDGRAHANPLRMKMISKAAQDVIKKMQSRCPACGVPGFSVVQRFPGLPCMDCGRPTRLIHAELSLCQKCGEHKKQELVYGELADPMYCDFCNP